MSGGQGYCESMLRVILVSFLAAIGLFAAPAAASDSQPPYWVSIRAKEVNMRIGPGEDYRIVWVYRRPNLPLKVLRVKEGWRLVQDPDGAQGWMLQQFLTRNRGGYVRGEGPADMREKPDETARLLWRVAPGVVGALGDCSDGWCAFDVDGRKGFVRANRIWGAGEP